jgi:hypothetical protein
MANRTHPGRLRLHGLRPGLSALAFAGLFAIYFVALIEGGESFLPMVITSLNLDRWLSPNLFYVELGTLHFFTPLLLIAGTAFSWHLLSGLNKQYSLNRIGRIGHRVLMLLTCVGFLVVM